MQIPVKMHQKYLKEKSWNIYGNTDQSNLKVSTYTCTCINLLFGCTMNVLLYKYVHVVSWGQYLLDYI